MKSYTARRYQFRYKTPDISLQCCYSHAPLFADSSTGDRHPGDFPTAARLIPRTIDALTPIAALATPPITSSPTDQHRTGPPSSHCHPIPSFAAPACQTFFSLTSQPPLVEIPRSQDTRRTARHNDHRARCKRTRLKIENVTSGTYQDSRYRGTKLPSSRTHESTAAPLRANVHVHLLPRSFPRSSSALNSIPKLHYLQRSPPT